MELGGREGTAALQKPLVEGEVEGSGDEAAECVNSVVGPLPLLAPAQQKPTSQTQSVRHKTVSTDSTGHTRGVSSSSSTTAASRILQEPFGLSSGAEASSSIGVRRTQRKLDLPGNTRRMMTPSRTSQDARTALQRSLRADTVIANCVAGRIDLEKLADILAPRATGDDLPSLRSPERSNFALSSVWTSSQAMRPAVTTTTSPSSGSTPGIPAKLQDAQMLQKYGTGENLVIQLRMFGDKDLFVFLFGCLVFWGFTPQQLHACKEGLQDFMERELSSQDLEEERMEFVTEYQGDADDDAADGPEGNDPEEAAGLSAIRQDQIILTTKNPLERLAHSYALAQSVRLSVFENAVDRSIANTRSIPETMAESGEVNLDARELSMQMGGLLMLRCDVNLHTDILDTPEIFWDEERFEPHYIACRSYLDVDKRVDILNQRLGVLKDLYDLLQNGLNVKHGNKLEIIIIVLILVEVLLELLELLHDSWTRA
jgi:uncharacterized Rmd1/YagE family protein